MRATLADSLPLLLAALQPPLVPAPAEAALKRTALALAPVPRGGFECRLGPRGGQVDLQQCVVRHEPEPTRLADHIAARLGDQPTGHDTPWGRVYKLAQGLAAPESQLHAGIRDLWLEFDVEDDSRALAPSIFVSLVPKLGAEQTDALVEEVSNILLDGARALLAAEAVKRCRVACPENAKISHVGFMLAREVDAVRVNIGGLAVDEMLPYLRQLGPRGSWAGLKALLTSVGSLVDRMTLCIDVGAQVEPRIGLECFLARQPERNPRWQAWLDFLVARGWCAPSKRDALLAWPGQTNPFNAPVSWPSYLLVDALSREPTVFGVFDRSLSHIKIVYQPRFETEAKAYLWFNYHWHDSQKVPELPFAADDPRVSSGADAVPYRDRVRAYYDATTTTYLEHLGPTLQADLVSQSSAAPDPRASNLWLARRAGVRAGQRVLDAGSGVAGPAVDIASAYPGIEIEAVTLSPSQAAIGQERIQQADLAGRVRIYVGDYHALPFAAATFDLVLFLESSGYSDDRAQLFAEVWRVLRPGGVVYIKDGFRRADASSERECRELDIFDRIYVHRTPTLEQTLAELVAAKFAAIRSRDLSSLASKAAWTKAMGNLDNGPDGLTDFGRQHYYPFEALPVYPGEVRARKPASRHAL